MIYFMEKAFLVGVNLNDGEDYQLSLEDVGALAQACDMEVAGIAEQTLPEVHKAFYIGTGKVDEVKELAAECDADVIIFDNSLSPMQLRNLQERLEKPILDRSTLILDIFASRAIYAAATGRTSCGFKQTGRRQRVFEQQRRWRKEAGIRQACVGTSSDGT